MVDISEGFQATLGESSPLDSNRRLIQVTSRDILMWSN